MTSVKVVKSTELSPEQVATWSELQKADPTMASPFLRPEFNQLVGAVRQDVEVGIMERDGQSVGFFPFQRRGKNVAVPVGGPLSACQGVVAKRGVSWEAADLVRDCGLAAWHFDSLVATQHPFYDFHQTKVDCPYMDLSLGFEAYHAAHRKRGSKRIAKIMGLGRKMGREVGDVRFESHTADRAVLDQLLEWKSAQFERTKRPNPFANDWTTEVLQRIVEHRGEAFDGMLSTLYVGDRPVAISLGMQSYGFHHGCFTGYDPELHKYSPGSVLLIELAKACETLGLQRLVLDTGPEAYKNSFVSGTFPLAQGAVDFRMIRGALVRCLHTAHEGLRASPIRGLVRIPWRMTRHFRAKLAYR